MCFKCDRDFLMKPLDKIGVFVYLCNKSRYYVHNNSIFIYWMSCSFFGNTPFVYVVPRPTPSEVHASFTFFPDFIKDNKKRDFKESEIFEQQIQATPTAEPWCGNPILVNNAQPLPQRDVSMAQFKRKFKKVTT